MEDDVLSLFADPTEISELLAYPLRILPSAEWSVSDEESVPVFLAGYTINSPIGFVDVSGAEVIDDSVVNGVGSNILASSVGSVSEKEVTRRKWGGRISLEYLLQRLFSFVAARITVHFYVTMTCLKEAGDVLCPSTLGVTEDGPRPEEEYRLAVESFRINRVKVKKQAN